MSRSMMDYATVIAVGEKVKAHCTANDSGAVYESGWSDARIAEEVGGATIHNVLGIRERLFGRLHKTKPASIEERLTALEVWAGQRPKCPFLKD